MNAKTSITHPLQIDCVDVSEAGGVIGMTICPGRKGPSMAVGAWDRTLALDLDVVRAWQPDLVIALLEDHEYATLGIPAFRSDVIEAGLPWVFAPIVDGGVPSAPFFERWQTLGPRARNILRRGGRVLIHCRAGLGRTGMLAALLLVELGANANAAIARVRAARAQTIETYAQEMFVRSAIVVRKKPERRAAIAGAMWGAAIGDAIGAAFEFVDAAAIASKLDEPLAWTFHPAMPGSLLYPRKPGLPTDDTAMALSVAHVVASGAPYTAQRFATAFLTDLDRANGRFGEMFWTGGPGSATLRALRNLKNGAEPATCGGIDDGGNGSAMRAHPIGFLDSREVVLEVAAIQAKVTHGEPASVAAAQAVAVSVFDALAGLEPELSPPLGIEDPKFVASWVRAHRGIQRGMDRLPPHLLDVDLSGWETVAAAHAIAYIYDGDPHRAIATAAASGRDTDTIASIVGAIVGARFGQNWLTSDLIAGFGATNAVREAIERLS